MKWSEVIMVRASDSNAEILAKTLYDLMSDLARSAEDDDIRIFHRENIETDICIVLFHRGEKMDTGGSPLALRIVAVFKEIGLVHHTVWNEIER
jgi:hypothetical protein